MLPVLLFLGVRITSKSITIIDDTELICSQLMLAFTSLELLEENSESIGFCIVSMHTYHVVEVTTIGLGVLIVGD